MSRRGSRGSGLLRYSNIFNQPNSLFGWNAPEQIPNPWAPTTKIDDTSATLEFGKRSGLAALGKQMNDLANALQNPGGQLTAVNEQLQEISATLSDNYTKIVKQLREQALPEEEVAIIADSYIRPQLAVQMDLLKRRFPYAVGNLGGGAFSPLEGIASGWGTAGAEYGASGQFKNYRTLKKAFKKAKRKRAKKRARHH